MTPAARLQAAIEIVDGLENSSAGDAIFATGSRAPLCRF